MASQPDQAWLRHEQDCAEAILLALEQVLAANQQAGDVPTERMSSREVDLALNAMHEALLRCDLYTDIVTSKDIMRANALVHRKDQPALQTAGVIALHRIQPEDRDAAIWSSLLTSIDPVSPMFSILGYRLQNMKGSTDLETALYRGIQIAGVRTDNFVIITEVWNLPDLPDWIGRLTATEPASESLGRVCLRQIILEYCVGVGMAPSDDLIRSVRRTHAVAGLAKIVSVMWTPEDDNNIDTFIRGVDEEVLAGRTDLLLDYLARCEKLRPELLGTVLADPAAKHWANAHLLLDAHRGEASAK